MKVQDEIKLYQGMIERTAREIAELEQRYKGVRPSWVSGDIGWLHVDIQRYKNLIHQLQQEAQ